MGTKSTPISVTIAHKKTGEEQTFPSIREAAKVIGVSAMQVSRIIRCKRSNNTDYYITDNPELSVTKKVTNIFHI